MYLKHPHFSVEKPLPPHCLDGPLPRYNEFIRKTSPAAMDQDGISALPLRFNLLR